MPINQGLRSVSGMTSQRYQRQSQACSMLHMRQQRGGIPTGRELLAQAKEKLEPFVRQERIAQESVVQPGLVRSCLAVERFEQAFDFHQNMDWT